jgi:cob(I)alamin adenosyltransferase
VWRSWRQQATARGHALGKAVRNSCGCDLTRLGVRQYDEHDLLAGPYKARFWYSNLPDVTAAGTPGGKQPLISTISEASLAKIYTRKGDTGQTRLFTGERVSKDEARMEALGCIDELVAFLGLARSEIKDAEIRSRVTAIQSELYLILSDIASAAQDKPAASKLPDDAIEIIESLIDTYDAKLPPLRDFIMPGESRASSLLHVARTVCRRAERRVVVIARNFPLNARVSAYLNRLSDLLFVMARLVDHEAGRPDQTFKAAL